MLAAFAQITLANRMCDMYSWMGFRCDTNDPWIDLSNDAAPRIKHLDWKLLLLPSGNVLHSHWKLPFTVSFPFIKMTMFHSFLFMFTRGYLSKMEIVNAYATLLKDWRILSATDGAGRWGTSPWDIQKDLENPCSWEKMNQDKPKSLEMCLPVF